MAKPIFSFRFGSEDLFPGAAVWFDAGNWPLQPASKDAKIARTINLIFISFYRYVPFLRSFGVIKPKKHAIGNQVGTRLSFIYQTSDHDPLFRPATRCRMDQKRRLATVAEFFDKNLPIAVELCYKYLSNLALDVFPLRRRTVLSFFCGLRRFH
jgi:hypothetical protein